MLKTGIKMSPTQETPVMLSLDTIRLPPYTPSRQKQYLINSIRMTPEFLSEREALFSPKDHREN